VALATTREALDRTGQSLLGKYELTRMLGKGGMGEVWEGEHSLTGRRVAVKILADNYLQNKKVVARFGREARAASSVNHPGIVEILDQDRTPDGVPFLVMEFLEGESVGERIRNRGKLPQDDALAIMLPLLDALDAAHQSGIIHRDLKPDNVFILPGARGEERIKILDFGISQKSDEIEHRLTQEGSVLGTPHYMSPEQAKGEAGIDARVDVYAAGVMFYECVVGDVPFDAGNYNALMQIILGTPPPAPRSRGADVSAAVEQVLLASMDKDRKRRPPSARAFHDLLLEAGMQEDDAMLDTETWSFTTPSEPPPPVDFGDMSESEFDSGPAPALPAPGRAKQPALAAGTFGDVEPPSSSAVRRVPAAPPVQNNSFAEPDDLEADLFAEPDKPQKFDSLQPPKSMPSPPRQSFGAPSPRGGGNPFGGAPAAPRPGGAFDGPTARGGAFDGPAPRPAGGYDAAPRPNAPFDPPAPRPGGAGGGNPFESGPGSRGVQIGAAPRLNQNQGSSGASASQRPERPRPERRATGAAPTGGFQLSPRADEPTLGRTILNWVITLVAIGGLLYLMQVVFTRPDPRKNRPATDPSAPTQEGAPAGETPTEEPATP